MDEPVIFVVDDDESVCRSLRRLIQSVGLHVRTFNSANEFWEQGCQNMHGCLLLDMKMPLMSGLDLQNKLIDSGFTMPIIFMSAHEDSVAVEQALKAGAVAYLQKPFEGQLLIEKINQALNLLPAEQDSAAKNNKVHPHQL
ncbi:MAG: response regulator transcription factor [Planctomycetota bacterium]|jgi:FixJ family two-component response regulator